MYRIALITLTAAMIACAAGSHSGDTDRLIVLPIRIHLLTSRTSTALSTTRTGEDARKLVGFANIIWQQAAVQWRVESVIHEESPIGLQFDSLITGKIRRTASNLIDFAPRTHLLSPGWNVFLVGDLGQIAGGMFRPEIEGVVLAERGFGFELPVEGRGGATLAHELGHSLTLGHEPCDSTRNILANACWSPTALSSLTPFQIARARQQALSGHPATEIPSP
jgi:hypothetical protein